jgi:hypothetical protein
MLLLGFSSDHELRNIESIWYTKDGATYPRTLKVLKLRNYKHSPFEKTLIKRVMRYFKDGTE